MRPKVAELYEKYDYSRRHEHRRFAAFVPKDGERETALVGSGWRRKD
jgi:hypothetical protein